MRKPSAKENIFKAAANLFSKQGYSSTSMRHIAEKVGVSKPAIYYHFPNKQVLYEELLKSALSQGRQRLDKIADSNKTPVEKLQGIAIYRFEECKNHPDISRFTHDAISGSIRKTVSLDLPMEFRFQQQKIHKIIDDGKAHGFFRKDVDTENLIFLLVGAINMYVLSYLKGWVKDLSATRAKELVNTLIEGIQTKPNTPTDN